MSEYDPVKCLAEEVARFKATNTFTPMLVTGFYVQAAVVLDRLADAQQTTQRLVELVEKCAKYFDMEDSSLFRPNNPFGKEIRAIVYELRAEIKKVKDQQ